MTADPQPVEITAADGYALGGTLFATDGADTVVIVHPATAVPQGFYRRFAAHIQQRGWTVLTYDFRGIGASAPESLKGFAGQASDWGLLDMPAALRWAERELTPRRVFFVGHSAGGQQAGLIDTPDSVTAMVTVSAQSGFWGYQGGVEKLRVLIVMGLVVPVLARAAGYLPWSRLAAGEDLPRNAALEWARWCRSPRYLLGDAALPLHRYANFRAPVLAYSIDDDDWGTARSVDAMMRAYPNLERRHLVPAQHGLKKLGHMGYFRQGSEALWDEAIEWFERAAG
ncbi:MAG: alpha/beta fold hydrolase [Pseudomonadota bacterium]